MYWSLHAESLHATASEGRAQGPYVAAIERDSNPRTSGRKASMRHNVPCLAISSWQSCDATVETVRQWSIWCRGQLIRAIRTKMEARGREVSDLTTNSRPYYTVYRINLSSGSRTLNIIPWMDVDIGNSGWWMRVMLVIFVIQNECCLATWQMRPFLREFLKNCHLLRSLLIINLHWRPHN